MKGPRSLVCSPIPTGGDEGWLDREIHWEKRSVSPGIAESCTVFRRFEFEGAALPRYVARFARWDAAADRAACDSDNATPLSLQVQHCEFPAESVKQILIRESELHRAMAATFANANERSDRIATMAYRWEFPGLRVTQSMSWLTGPHTSLLEKLFAATMPVAEELRPARFIERFDRESSNDYFDATLDQLPTIHQLLAHG